MCIIIDANAAHDIIKQKQEGLPVLKWLLSSNAKSGLVVGGELGRELRKAGFENTLVALSRAGRLHIFSDDVLNQVVVKLKADKACKSNDEHVVALAKVSRCPIVYTRDKNLHVDLKNRKILRHGVSIYQTADHASLLTTCECRRG